MLAAENGSQNCPSHQIELHTENFRFNFSTFFSNLEQKSDHPNNVINLCSLFEISGINFELKAHIYSILDLKAQNSYQIWNNKT